MGKLASGLSSICSRYFLSGVLFVLAFVTALIEIADGFKILKREYLAMVSKVSHRHTDLSIWLEKLLVPDQKLC